MQNLPKPFSPLTPALAGPRVPFLPSPLAPLSPRGESTANGAQLRLGNCAPSLLPFAGHPESRRGESFPLPRRMQRRRRRDAIVQKVMAALVLLLWSPLIYAVLTGVAW